MMARVLPPAVTPAVLNAAEQDLLCEILNRDPEGGVAASPTNLHRFVLKYAQEQVLVCYRALNEHGRDVADGLIVKLAAMRDGGG